MGRAESKQGLWFRGFWLRLSGPGSCVRGLRRSLQALLNPGRLRLKLRMRLDKVASVPPPFLKQHVATYVSTKPPTRNSQLNPETLKCTHQNPKERKTEISDLCCRGAYSHVSRRSRTPMKISIAQCWGALCGQELG